MSKLIYLGCLSNRLYESTCKNVIKIIQFLDSEYQIIEDPPCCGSLAFNITPDETMRTHVEDVNKWFKNNNITEIVTICAGCYSYFTRYYSEFLGAEFKVNVQHFLQFIADPKNLDRLNLKYSGDNGIQIAWQGLIEYQSRKKIIPAEKLKINPVWRIDQVDVTWMKS